VVAAAIRHRGELVGALAAAAPTARMRRLRPAAVAERLCAAAARIGERLAGRVGA
jgi:DNA-binding IclR family transcriptional regulator